MSIKQTIANIKNISPLTNSILQVVLNPEEYIAYEAGQYLQIMRGDETFSYSIANAPLGSHRYELHIRHSRDNPYNQNLLADIKQTATVRLQLPLGECCLSRMTAEKPILFIAAGTGFAPIKAMVEQLLANGDSRNIELIWGARSQSDLYMDELVTHWQAHVPHFNYVSLLSEHSKETLASMALARHQQRICDCLIVICGPFDLVYSTRDALVKQGVSPQNIFSDAFSFEAKK